MLWQPLPDSRELVHEALITTRESWQEFSFDLRSFDPELECRVVFTSAAPLENPSIFGGTYADVFEGSMTAPGLGEVALNYPNKFYTRDRDGDTITFRVEMNRGKSDRPAHNFTHAELVVENAIVSADSAGRRRMLYCAALCPRINLCANFATWSESSCHPLVQTA